jgi:hypothetical protein
MNLLLVSTTAIALVQFGAIVGGHLLGVVTAHDRAAALFPDRDRLRGQSPLLAMMVVYARGALPLSPGWPTIVTMCRNITTLRGLEPPATDEEIEAAARQYVRKVSGITRPTAATEEAFEVAVASVAQATAEVLRHLPERRQPPKAVPPLRRPEVRARMG